MARRAVVYSTTILACLMALIALKRSLYHTTSQVQSYTYVGDDFPELWDVDTSEPVAMIMEESRWYPAHGGRDTTGLWATTSPVGLNYIRIGPEMRAFSVAMFHEMHCLRFIRVIVDGRYDEESQEHLQHCLNVLRQTILCSPDLTLEPADVLDRDFEVNRVGSTHVCSDWSVMYTEAEANFNHWRTSLTRNPSANT
ncbi:Hydrolase-4 domain-containing protein [Mycena sanguinolenta]|uniref:Hydrolase-4 domain-containing protein n=1 Tax=Mycena sanguinolenta TaxID=230812 RepID=A0A8H7DA46_9AGAR|nr:Hydrolase-4 domain-containing protein [Mycena sanguinolenta]